MKLHEQFEPAIAFNQRILLHPKYGYSNIGKNPLWVSMERERQRELGIERHGMCVWVWFNPIKGKMRNLFRKSEGKNAF